MAKSRKSTNGRPPRLTVCLESPDDLERIKRAAKADKRKPSDWARLILQAAASAA